MKRILFTRPLVVAVTLFLAFLFLSLFCAFSHSLLVGIITFAFALVFLFLFFFAKRLSLSQKLRRLLPILFLLCLFLSLAAFLAEGVLHTAQKTHECYDEGSFTAIFLVEEVTNEDNYDYAEGIFTEIDGETTKIKGTAVLLRKTFVENEFLAAGDEIRATFRFTAKSGNTLAEKQGLADGFFLSAFSEEPYTLLSQNNKTATLTLNAFRQRIGSLLEKSLPENAQGLMKALLTADKSSVPDKVSKGFSTLGISHLFAVSGLHLSILVGLFALLFEKLRLRHSIRYPILAAITLFYMVITAFTPSMLRAGGMLLLFYLSYFSNRKRESVTSLLVATSVIVLLSPASVLDIGLLLSFLATLGILLIGNPLLSAVGKLPLFAPSRRYTKLLSYPVRFVFTTVVMTFAASALTLPILYLIEGKLFLLVFLSNPVFAPFFSLFLLLLPIVFLLLPIPPLMSALGFLLEKLTLAVYSLAEAGKAFSFLSVSLSYPFIPILLLLLFGSMTALLIKKKGTFLPLIPILCFFLLVPVGIALDDMKLNERESVYYHTNGKSDSLSLTYEKKGLLIDCSASSSFIGDSFSLATWKSASIKTDSLMLTNCRTTHLPAILSLCGDGDLAHLILPIGSDTAETLAQTARENGVTVTFYTPGDTVYWNEIALKTYADPTHKYVLAIDVTMENRSLLYLRENAPDEFDIRFGPLSEHRDVILLGAYGNAAKSYPFVFDADTVVQGSDFNYVKKTGGTTLLFGDYREENKRTTE